MLFLLKVVINDNPLDGNKTYQITFIHKASKKPFTLGPGTVKFIVEELKTEVVMFPRMQSRHLQQS